MSKKITEIRFTKTMTYIWDWRRKTEWEKGCTEKIKKNKTDTDWTGGEQEKGKRKKTKVYRETKTKIFFVYVWGGKREIM